MKILIAPDKFKGSLSAAQVGEAIRLGLLDAEVNIGIEVVPLADGGEGTTEVLTNFSKGRFIEVEVRDPLQRKVMARYGVSGDGTTAFIEMAAASGLHLLQAQERNPLLTSTAGTGDLIRHALDLGVRNIYVGIGGSATNDAGMGAMTALGARFYDATGSLLDGTGRALVLIEHIDTSALHPALAETSFSIFCDVDNPLYGPHGAASIFGPQKGATPEDVHKLDAGLRHYERVLWQHGYTHTNFPGAGAGGGFSVSLAAFSKVCIRPGIESVLEFVGFEDRVREADLVITGEGRLDEQTLSGKVVKGVSMLANRQGKPVIAVVGSSSLDQVAVHQLQLGRVISLVDETTSAAEAIANAQVVIQKRVREWFKTAFPVK